MDGMTSLLRYETSFCSWSCPSSDSEFYSLSSPETVSPVPSMDLVFSSPPKRSDSQKHDLLPYSESSLKSTTSSPEEQGRPVRTRTRSRMRAKNPSKQRQSASEKEKLRMRDLTRALHHLRTYLPASVAPVGQTLTKIETLRLTIRYIAHLSAQLGLSEDALHRRKDTLEKVACQQLSPPPPQPPHSAPHEILGCFQYATATSATLNGQWGPCQGHEASAFVSQQGQPSLTTAKSMPVDLGQYGSAVEMPVQNGSFGNAMGMEYLLQTSHSMQSTQPHQMYNTDFGCQLIPQEHWS